jgi:hypothetical protein
MLRPWGVVTTSKGLEKDKEGKSGRCSEQRAQVNLWHGARSAATTRFALSLLSFARVKVAVVHLRGTQRVS